MTPRSLLFSLALAGSVVAQPFGLTPDAPRTQDLSQVATVAPPQQDGRVYERDGVWYIRAVPGDTPDTLARDAYGNPELWFLLIHHNEDLLAGRSPGDDGPIELVIPPPPRHRVMPVGEEILLRVIPGDTLAGIAADIYQNAGAWQAIAAANEGLEADPEAPIPVEEGQRMAVIVLPRPQAGTVGGSGTTSQPGGPRTGTTASTGGAWPGDFRSSGTTTRPSPRTGAGVIDWGSAMGGAGDPLVVSPQPGGGSSIWSGGGPTYRTPGAVDRGPLPTGPSPTPSDSERAAAPLAGGIQSLNIRSAADIGPREAATILEATGFTHSRIVQKHTPPARNAQEAALMALAWGNTYKRPRQRVPLDSKSQGWLFEAYTQLREAQEKYRGWPDISRRSNPQAYERWVVDASRHLTNVPANQRVALMRSLMQTETGQSHWDGYKPVVSHSGAVGFGQFLPATARGLGINPYDPAQNIEGIARYVNQLIGSSGGNVRQALAKYNGGNSPPSSSYRYADGILSRLA